MPATVDGWAVVGGQEQGGVKGWFRSMAIPRRWAGGMGEAGTRGNFRRSDATRRRSRISLREAVRPIGNMEKQGAGVGSLSFRF